MSLSFAQCLLVGIIYALCGFSFLASYTTTYRPLVCATIVGAFFGDIKKGAELGAQINLIYIGFMSVGGSSPGDPCLAGCVSTALCIAGDLPLEMGLAMAVPVGLLGGFIYVFRMTTNSFFARVTEKFIEQDKDLFIPTVIGPFIYYMFLAVVPTTALLALASGAMDSLAAVLNGPVLAAVAVVGGMMPALGIAMNLFAIFKGNARIFLFVGFAMAAYLHLPVMCVTIFGLAMALVYTQLAKE